MNAQPFYCPYCGETDIRHGEAERSYHCEICDRTFELRFVKLGA
jgi:transposase-like protein